MISEGILEIKVSAKQEIKNGKKERRNSREEWATNFSVESKESKNRELFFFILF